MARHSIQKRGTGWRVSIRVGGEQHWFGPRNEEFLRGATKNEVEEWAWMQPGSSAEGLERALPWARAMATPLRSASIAPAVARQMGMSAAMRR